MHQTPPDTTRHAPDTTRHHQTISDRLAVVLCWFIELYSWSRFFLPTGGRADGLTKVIQEVLADLKIEMEHSRLLFSTSNTNHSRDWHTLLTFLNPNNNLTQSLNSCNIWHLICLEMGITYGFKDDACIYIFYSPSPDSLDYNVVNEVIRNPF